MRRDAYPGIMLCSMAIAFSVGAMAQPSLENEAPPYRIAQELGACFCPSSHLNSVISSRARLDEMIGSRPCTSRGDGAEKRAKIWGDRCLDAVSRAGLDFERGALVYVGRFFSSGMISGSLEVSALRNGVLTLRIRQHRPQGPLTPDLGFFAKALIVDKTRIGQIKIDDGKGGQVLLSVGAPKNSAK